MKGKTIAILISVVALFAVQTSAKAAQKESDYEKLNDVLVLLKEAKSPYVEAKIQLEIKQPSIQINDVKIWLTQNGQKIADVSVSPNGEIQFPTFTQAKGIKFHANQQDDDIAISLSAGVRDLDVTEIEYDKLFVLLDDVNAFMEVMAGGFSMFVPSMDAITFTFNEPAYIEVLSKSKLQRFDTDRENKISLDVSKKLRTENPTVKFSQLPTTMSPDN
ncbi:hypothetical protein PALB_8090 [Pseudoalteromonas luteoviolacea B = ATCC 29581]|nr:hypothetical protein PALB_8090 [Pseudoalteromonas luteoviolacea B = ATCC 29581]